MDREMVRGCQAPPAVEPQRMLWDWATAGPDLDSMPGRQTSAQIHPQRQRPHRAPTPFDPQRGPGR